MRRDARLTIKLRVGEGNLNISDPSRWTYKILRRQLQVFNRLIKMSDPRRSNLTFDTALVP